MAILEMLSNALWIPGLLGLFLLVGGYYTLRTGFFQFRCLPACLRTTVGAVLRGEGNVSSGLSPLQTLSTALASTIGTGSIAGVATAICFGGPGAVFWMWCSALLGMMTGFAEKTLSVRYRKNGPKGNYGGPMYYISQGLGSRPLAAWFCGACICASFVGGNLVQANSIATVTYEAFGWTPAATCFVLAAVLGLTMRGGLGRIASVSQFLVPVMAGIFLISGGAILCLHARELPEALWQIFTQAFSLRPAAAGGAGYGIAAAARYGVARGVFTNEAGLGSSAIAHAASGTRLPARQGLWGIVEVCASTMVVCTMTALVILVSGVYEPTRVLNAILTGQEIGPDPGAALSARAFSDSLGPAGAAIVAMCVLLFAFTSMLGWSYYGEQAIFYLDRRPEAVRVYRAAFVVMTAAAGGADTQAVWLLSDLADGMMALPNLSAILLLSPEVAEEFGKLPQELQRERKRPGA